MHSIRPQHSARPAYGAGRRGGPDPARCSAPHPPAPTAPRPSPGDQGATTAMPKVQPPALVPSLLHDLRPLTVSFTEEELAGPTVQMALKYLQEEIPPPQPEELLGFRYEEPSSSSGRDPSSLGVEARQLIDSQLPLTGALLLQGLPIQDAGACSAFVKAMGYTLMKYEPYGGERLKIGDLDAATNIPPSWFLDVHNEMCYNPRPNRKIMLICLRPAQRAGESLLASGERIMQLLPQDILRRFKQRGGVRYNRLYPSALAPSSTSGFSLCSWQQRTGCSTCAAAQQFWEDLGCNVEWRPSPSPNPSPRQEGEGGGEAESRQQLVWNVQPAVVTQPGTGAGVWFNNAHMAAMGVGATGISYGSGEEIEAEVVEALAAARMGAMRVLALGAGDVLVLDNYRMLHGRMPFSGDGRIMVTVLTQD